MASNQIAIVYAITSNGEYCTAYVPVGWERGTWSIKDLMPPAQLAQLARFTNRLKTKG